MNGRVFLAGSLAPSMLDKVCKCESGGFLGCKTLSLQKFINLCNEREINSYFTDNDKAIMNKLDELGISHNRIKERIELDPELGDILLVMRAKNFNILKEDKIPNHVTIEIYMYTAMSLENIKDYIAE